MEPNYPPPYQQPTDPYAPMNNPVPQQPMPMSPPLHPMASPPHHPSSLPHPANVGDKIEQIIMLSYFCVAALLGFRFALGLFGARVSPFVNFIHDISIPFMIPFEGMFGATPRAGYYSIEFEALVAIIVYALVFFGLGRLVKILFK